MAIRCCKLFGSMQGNFWRNTMKPFFDASHGGSGECMTVDELEQGKQWLSDTFHLIRCEDDSLSSINWILNLARAVVLRHGVRGHAHT
ncbi:hypothetical protein RGQ29_017930 [Quercus rubra]|uniref:Uncharacterized protein n=1 Tax=Quercus rubra TaxID=3512 RepID=A0AAN7FI74_QUERU|nr:hypothetical protein RGQ29_017930 [Quercus rubra]